MMNLTMLTPEREIFKGNIQSITVPGVGGKFQILKNHAPIVSALEAGVVTVVTAVGESLYFDDNSGTIKTIDEAGKTLQFKIGGGFIEVLNNSISVLLSSVREESGVSA